jgi:hypothetical protein
MSSYYDKYKCEECNTILEFNHNNRGISICKCSNRQCVNSSKWEETDVWLEFKSERERGSVNMDYKQIAEDIRSGDDELEGMYLEVDKHTAWWAHNGEVELTDEEIEAKVEYLDKKYGRSNGLKDFYLLLYALGIDSEEC